MIRTLQFIWNHPLSRRGRFRAISRYLRWQIGSRILPMPVIVPFIEESRLVMERSMTGATGNWYCGLHEFHDMAFVLHVLRPKDLFLDVGANIGTYTILASRVVGANTIAIEPVPSTYQRLKRNIRCNDIEAMVDARACVAGDQTGSIWFSTDRDTVNQVVDERYVGTKQRIETNRLDVILGDRNPLVWKVDVEGFEESVLAGATLALRSPQLQAVLLEADTDAIRQTMISAGFHWVMYDAWKRECRLVQSPSKSQASQNHLWIRDLEWVNQRCRSARSFEVNGVAF